MTFEQRVRLGSKGQFLQQSYAQWVRKAIDISRRSGGQAVSLFDSSVPEPRELLRQAVADSVAPEFSPYYVSAFLRGNRFVVERLAETYNVATEQVLCTTGASTALSLLVRALAEPGDRVLIETPGFDLFTTLAVDAHLDIGYFQRTGPDYSIDVEMLASAITPRTRLIILTNLHNPSGMALDYSILERIAALAEARGVLVLVDEVYGDYASPLARPCAAASLSPALVSVSSLTKSFGLAAVRCGWIVGSREVVDAVREVNARIEFGVSNLAHAVAAQILFNPEPFMAYSSDGVARSRPALEQWFAQSSADGLVAGKLPEAGCICFPALPGVRDTEAFSNWLVKRYGVVVAPGEYFGQPGHIRIGFVQPEGHLERGLSALSEALRIYGSEQDADGLPR